MAFLFQIPSTFQIGVIIQGVLNLGRLEFKKKKKPCKLFYWYVECLFPIKRGKFIGPAMLNDLFDPIKLLDK